MKTKSIAILAMISALYLGVSIFLAPISFASVQVRVAEALSLLPVLLPSSIIALTIGCFLTNLVGVISGTNVLGYLDIVVGTAATFIAACLTYLLRKQRVKGYPLLASVPPIAINALFIGLELTWVLQPGGVFDWQVFSIMFWQIFTGQFIAIFVIGLPLIKTLEKREIFSSRASEESD